MIQVLSRALHVFFGFGPTCRFQPTCTQYSRQAFDLHGPVKGLVLTVKRICHCHPWGGYGFDPVPERKK
jgi:putative membrane protein insertion efficiency factor